MSTRLKKKQEHLCLADYFFVVLRSNKSYTVYFCWFHICGWSSTVPMPNSCWCPGVLMLRLRSAVSSHSLYRRSDFGEGPESTVSVFAAPLWVEAVWWCGAASQWKNSSSLEEAFCSNQHLTPSFHTQNLNSFNSVSTAPSQQRLAQGAYIAR